MEKIICPNCGSTNLPNAKYCSTCGHQLPEPQVVAPAVQRPQTSNKQLSQQRKRLLGLFGGVVGFLIAYFAVQRIFFSPPSFDKQMMTVASELNKTCPIMVDQSTRLDNVIALPDNILQYNYTLVSNNISDINADAVKKSLEPALTSNIKTSPEMKSFRDHKTTLVYNYRDKNGAFVFKITVTPDMYQ